MKYRGPASGRATRRGGGGFFPRFLGPVFGTVCLVLMFCFGAAHAPGQTGGDRPHISGIDALEREAGSLGNAITNQIKAVSDSTAQQAANAHSNLLLDVILVLAGMALLTKVCVKLAEISNRRDDPSAARGTATKAEAAAEEKSFAEFAAAFSSGASARASEAPLSRGEVQTARPEKRSEENAPVQVKPRDFAQEAAKRLGVVRKLFSEIGKVPGEAAQHRILGELYEEIGRLRRDAEEASVRPVWQMAAALEGLVHQLVERAATVTPSSLRTLASAIDLLHGLRLRGLDPNLATEPPVRLLVVDDDVISRYAMAFALKKVFSPPDVAANGEEALALAEVNAYEAIFLDIQMPGMDGFELCSRIHGTAPNATTPVVFVTCCSDFDARSRSVVMGGQDLLGKPFLTFELAVKALTLVLRRRIEARALALRSAAPAPKPATREAEVKTTKSEAEPVKALQPVAAA